jgi:DNA (cytosine-5)-methyltransferase 1
MTRSPRLLNLFAGAGGLALGFEQAGVVIAGAVEPDPVHAATFKRNFPNAAVLCAPVSREHVHKFVGGDQFDIVAGGLPSSAFSYGGRRDPDDDRRQLLDRFIDVVGAIQPAMYAVEAVPGVLARANASQLRLALERLGRVGYATPQIWNLDAADFALPQTRLRVWIVGIKDTVDPPTAPAATVIPVHRRPAGLPVLPRDGKEVGPTVWDAIGDLPDPNEYVELRTGDRMRKPTALPNPSEWAAPLTSLTPIGHSPPRQVDGEMLTASQATAHAMSSVWRFAETLPGTAEPVSRFYRLHPEGLSRTLRAGTGRDRGSFTGPRPLHPHQPRVITVREGARLQGFPDWFGFSATKWHGFHQVGASAPPPVARAVAERIVDALGLPAACPSARPVPDESLLFLDLTRAARRLGATVLPQPRRRGVGARPRPRRTRSVSPQLAFAWERPAPEA